MVSVIQKRVNVIVNLIILGKIVHSLYYNVKIIVLVMVYVTQILVNVHVIRTILD